MFIEIEKAKDCVLDYLIAKAIWPTENIPAWWFTDRPDGCYLPSMVEEEPNPVDGFFPQTDWGLSGAFLAAKDIFPFKWMDGEFAYGAQLSCFVNHRGQDVTFQTAGATPLVAAWRCFVASQLGKYSQGFSTVMVEVPDSVFDL